MTAQAEMAQVDVAQAIIDKADTIVALGAAAISGGWAYYVKRDNIKLTNAQAKQTDAQTEQTAVETMIQVAHELRMDMATVKSDLKACHDEKAAMSKRIDHQNEVIQDITEALSRSMELQGLPMPIKRPHRDELTGA